MTSLLNKMADDIKGVYTSVSSDGNPLPLFITPKDGNDSVIFLKQWVKKNQSWLEKKVLEHGAVMFRGFAVKEARDFEQTILQFQPKLSTAYRGTSPRKLISGTRYVFSASELPSYFPIPQHLEMAFLPAPPRNLFFCCLVAPTSTGGETCLCDFKEVYNQLDPAVRQKFEDKGVMYVRNYHRKKTYLTDPTMLKGWEDVFDTDCKDVIEDECRKSELDFSWSKNDDLKIVNKAAACEDHPVTGERVWFNHAQVFHWNMVWDELYRVHKRLGRIKYLILSILMFLLKLFFLNVRGGTKCGFHTMYGDGTEIAEKDMQHVRDVMWRNMVFNRWQKGDFVIIDNYRVSHGRQPFNGPRKVVVSWSDPYLRPSCRKSDM